MTPPAQARARFGLVVALALGTASFVSRASGEEAPRSVLYAPIDLEVIDVDATIAIATKAGERLPLVLVQDPEVALAVVAGFDATFVQTRERFLERMAAAFGTRSLDAAAVGGQEFRDLRADFQEDNALFPVSPALAQTWARGFDGDPVRERIAALLRSLEREQLIGEIRPASSIFVVAPGAGDGARTWGEVVPRARAVEAAAVLTPAAAGELLRRLNDPLDRAAGGYLSGLIRANVAEDRHLTGLLLRDRLGGAAVHRVIPRGARLFEAGRAVDSWAELALAQLVRLGIQPLDASAPDAVGAAPVEDAATAPVPPLAGGGMSGWWIAGMVVLVAGAAGVVLAALKFRRRSSSLVQVAGSGAATGAGELVIPHLAREWKDRLVRALFTQRSVLLANEQAASRRVQEMEERLARLQPAIAEKIRGYEQRIEALEKEISERDADTRDLLRAKLVLARKELDAEISRNRLDWN